MSVCIGNMNIILVEMMILAGIVVGGVAQLPSGCPSSSKCGDLQVPYPFSTTQNCSLDASFLLHCNGSKLYGTGKNITVTDISLKKNQVTVQASVSHVCYNYSDGQVAEDFHVLRLHDEFTVSSTENKFIAVGCDTVALLGLQRHQTNEISHITGCLSLCNTTHHMTEGFCTGNGCCKVGIPQSINNIAYTVVSIDNHSAVRDFNNCSYAFVAQRDWYKFSHDHLTKLPFNMSPMVLDWAIGNQKCQQAQKNNSYACRENSDCSDSSDGYGYRCTCSKGYDGNPYLHGGCTDVDECKNPKLNNCWKSAKCRNTMGSFECYCPHGYKGDGRKDGTRCTLKLWEDPRMEAAVGATIGLVALLLCISWLYFMLKKRRLIKLREKFFLQNGGFVLQQRLARQEGTSKTAEIFTEDELKKASNNYDNNLVIGKGGFGTVYKGFLEDNRVVAIKKSKIVDQSQNEQFINEVVVLSQINHRNVVKLLGCCLETEVPLLVYEFINNGTLFDYIHDRRKTANISWETRLRIAAETAGALSYLHSAASTPIIHRDVKTTNILLDENFTVKVSDFGASKLVPMDHTQLATIVQGTLGYLDPEYMLTSQLTEKSDVYSFGVVLLELLTGLKALSFDRPEEERSLAAYFLSCLKDDGLFNVIESGIVNDENKQQIKEMAILAARCLQIKGEDRPSMKDVAMELEGMRKVDKHPWATMDLNSHEGERLLHGAAVTNDYGDSYVNSASAVSTSGTMS